MSVKILVGIDDSKNSQNALDFAVATAKAQGGEIVVAHVLEWSPYSFLTPEEIEERSKRRSEELERAKTAIIDPVLKKLDGSGVKIGTSLKYGHITETLCDTAKEEKATQIVIGRTGHSKIESRLFGSVAGSLAQIAPVAVTIVP